MELVQQAPARGLDVRMIGNHFIAGLEVEDRNALLRGTTRVNVAAGQVLIEQGDEVRIVHLPTTAHLANITHNPDGERLQTAVVVSEGMTGLAPFLANAPCAWQVVCAVAGEAMAIPADSLRHLSEHRLALRRRLLTLTHFYQAQANQLALCNTLHTVDQRLARWILTLADRSVGAPVSATQGRIAADLGVQRTSVASAFQKARAAGLISLGRSRVDILDWPSLMARSCGCYGQMRRLECDLGVIVSDPLPAGRAANAPS